MAEAKHEETVALPWNKLSETILDFPSYPRFVSGVKASQVLETSQQSLIVRMDLEMIKRIEYDIQVYQEIDAANAKAKIWWTLKSGDLFKKNDGAWELRSVGPDKTHVVYRLDVEFNFSVPGFILKNLIKKSLPGAVHDFCEETRKRMAR